MTPHTVILPTGHAVTDDRTRLDMAHVLACLDTAAWSVDRPHEITRRSFANCLPIGIHAPAGPQVGFGRLLTDYATRAHLADVFIEPRARGLGLGKALVAYALAHPALATVTHWTLTTGDAHGLYERYGFRIAECDGKWMTLERGQQ